MISQVKKFVYDQLSDIYEGDFRPGAQTEGNNHIAQPLLI
jgi:hypothetical protein